MYLHELGKDVLPEDARKKLPTFERLDFIAAGENILLKSLFIRAPDIFISGMPDMKIPSFFFFKKIVYF